jgi:putative ABC transport system permease protein
LLAGVINAQVFNSPATSPAWLFAAALASALTVALCGSVLPLRRALAVEPVRALQQ